MTNEKSRKMAVCAFWSLGRESDLDGASLWSSPRRCFMTVTAESAANRIRSSGEASLHGGRRFPAGGVGPGTGGVSISTSDRFPHRALGRRDRLGVGERVNRSYF